MNRPSLKEGKKIIKKKESERPRKRKQHKGRITRRTKKKKMEQRLDFELKEKGEAVTEWGENLPALQYEVVVETSGRCLCFGECKESI